MPIDPDLKAIATSKAFAALTTLDAEGMPSTNIMWIDADDEHLLINTELHRRKYKNMTADPRVVVLVMDPDNPYRFIEARGRVAGTVGGQAARDHIDALGRRYTGDDYPDSAVKSERVIVQITPEKLYKRKW
jgi:PPOX class probable F420-dependent enzyme